MAGILEHLLLAPNDVSQIFRGSVCSLVCLSYQLSAGRHVPLRADDLAKGVRRLNFKFSKHALEELERRQIPRTTIERVLESPEQKLPVLENIICYQSRVNFGGKQYLLRVMVNEAAEQSVVVTVYRTSKVRKYWKEP
jgi:Domain of unknown function (DUF4258)